MKNEIRDDRPLAAASCSAQPLPITLQCYVDFMAAENRPLPFSEIVKAYKSPSPGKKPNWFRGLEKRRLIENIVPGYKIDEPYTGPRIPLYVLTERGRLHASPNAKPSNRGSENECE